MRTGIPLKILGSVLHVNERKAGTKCDSAIRAFQQQLTANPSAAVVRLVSAANAQDADMLGHPWSVLGPLARYSWAALMEMLAAAAAQTNATADLLTGRGPRNGRAGS